MVAYGPIGFLGMLGQASQFAIGRRVDPLRVWKGFGKIRLGEVLVWPRFTADCRGVFTK